MIILVSENVVYNDGRLSCLIHENESQIKFFVSSLNKTSK